MSWCALGAPVERSGKTARGRQIAADDLQSRCAAVRASVLQIVTQFSQSTQRAQSKGQGLASLLFLCAVGLRDFQRRPRNCFSVADVHRAATFLDLC